MLMYSTRIVMHIAHKQYVDTPPPPPPTLLFCFGGGRGRKGVLERVMGEGIAV